MKYLYHDTNTMTAGKNITALYLSIYLQVLHDKNARCIQKSLLQRAEKALFLLIPHASMPEWLEHTYLP